MCAQALRVGGSVSPSPINHRVQPAFEEPLTLDQLLLLCQLTADLSQVSGSAIWRLNHRC